MHKDGRWAKEILALQEEDGKWGWFHTCSKFYPSPITTEQALRRLKYLGYTIEDACIQRAVNYMNDCLTGKNEIPDRREKLDDWDIFTSLMLAARIREFTKENAAANLVAHKWTQIIYAAFAEGHCNHEEYIKAYQEIMGLKPKGGKLIDFVNFYPISLLDDCLEETIENLFLEYILNYEAGIYYIYENKINTPPSVFESKAASRYLGAVELLLRYKAGSGKLQFVKEWLENHKNENGKWDMGTSVKDKVYFPLSDGWGKEEREADCTERITNIIQSLTLP